MTDIVFFLFKVAMMLMKPALSLFLPTTQMVSNFVLYDTMRKQQLTNRKRNVSFIRLKQRKQHGWYLLCLWDNGTDAKQFSFVSLIGIFIRIPY